MSDARPSGASGVGPAEEARANNAQQIPGSEDDQSTPAPNSQSSRTDEMTQEQVNSAVSLAYPVGVTTRGPFYALTFRNFRLFFVGQLISVAGTWMQTVAQNWLVWDVTHQARWLGIVSGASAIPYVAFAMWGGHVADRY